MNHYSRLSAGRGAEGLTQRKEDPEGPSSTPTPHPHPHPVLPVISKSPCRHCGSKWKENGCKSENHKWPSLLGEARAGTRTPARSSDGERDLVCVPTEKRGRETTKTEPRTNQAVRCSRYKRRGSWFFHEADLSRFWSFATEAVEQSLPERMERWWFPTQMLHSLGLLDPIRGHISHQPRRDALSLLTTFLYFSHRVIWPQLIFICCLMSPRRSFPPSAVVLRGRRLQKLPGWAKVLVFRFGKVVVRSGKLEYSRSGHRYVSLGKPLFHRRLCGAGGGVCRRSPPPDAFCIWRGSAGVEGMAVKSI